MELWLAHSLTQWQSPLTEPLVVPPYILLLRQFVKEWGVWEECSRCVLTPIAPFTYVTVTSGSRRQQRGVTLITVTTGLMYGQEALSFQSLLKVIEMTQRSSLLLAKLGPAEGDEFCPLNNFLKNLYPSETVGIIHFSCWEMGLTVRTARNLSNTVRLQKQTSIFIYIKYDWHNKGKVMFGPWKQ